MNRTHSLLLETNHGTYELVAQEDDTVAAVLRKAGIPLSAVWTFLRNTSTQAVRFIPSSSRISEATLSGQKVVARVSRNIDIFPHITEPTSRVREVDTPSTEWVFPDEAEGGFHKVLCQMSADECLKFVRRSVEEVLDNWPSNQPTKMVVGTSGGGDSNAMLSALVSLDRVKDADIVPVMILGIPDWDSQLDHAKTLCEDAGTPLHVVTSDEASRILGVSSIYALWEAFLDRYPDADVAFLGTWIIRRVLAAYAKRLDVHFVAVGANREDVVSEGLARIATGRLPLPVPFRRIGPITFVYPMWKVPKKIGDGVFPRYSLDNYESRTPDRTLGRSLFYYVAYALSDVSPGLDLTLLKGFAELSQLDDSPIVLDETLDDYVCRNSYSLEHAQGWRDLLASVR